MYLVSTLSPDLEDQEADQRAALSIRIAYHLALETFFSLLFATFQAPICIAAWLTRYKTKELLELVRRVGSGEVILNQWQTPRPDWHDLAGLMIRGWEDDPDGRGATISNFAETWRNLSKEFLDQHVRGEYNNAKHGFRTQPGGFSLRVGLESEYGQAAPESAMETLVASKYGSSFFESKSLQESHITLERNLVNWSVGATAGKTLLLALSMRNLIGAVRVQSGVPPNEVQFFRPESAEAFKAPWNDFPTVPHLAMNPTIHPEHIDPISREEIERILRKASGII